MNKKRNYFSVYLGFKLNIPLTNPGIGQDCPPNSYLDRGQCNCNTGYRSENNNKCGKTIVRV